MSAMACWICGMPSGNKRTCPGTCARLGKSVLTAVRHDERWSTTFASRYGAKNEWVVWATRQLQKVRASKRCDRRLVFDARKRLAKRDEGMKP